MNTVDEISDSISMNVRDALYDYFQQFIYANVEEFYSSSVWTEVTDHAYRHCSKYSTVTEVWKTVCKYEFNE